MARHYVRWRETKTAYWVWWGLRGFWECRAVGGIPMAIFGIDFYPKSRKNRRYDNED